MNGVVANTVTNGSITLDTGDKVTCSVTYTVTAADVTAGVTLRNTASASGEDQDANSVASPNATADVQINGLKLVKSVKPGTNVMAGQTVNYTFDVTNTGSAAISDIGIDESSFTGSGSLSAITCDDDSLAAGASTQCHATYQVTQDDIDAGVAVTNTATATGKDGDGNSVVSSDSTTQFTVAQPTPSASLSLLKTADQSSALVLGEGVNYSFLVTNTGGAAISSITIDDSTFSGSSTLPAITCPKTTLAPDESMTCKTDANHPYIVTQTDINSGSLANTATAVGKDPSGTTVTSNSSKWDIPQAANPHVSIKETPNPASGLRAGDPLTFTITATNDGNVTLTAVTVANNATGWTGAGTMPTIASCTVNGISVTNGAFSLEPGQQVVCQATQYTVTQADIDAGTPIVNQAVVTGTPPSGSQTPVVTASATAPATPVAGNAHVSISETPSPASGLKAGDSLVFTITATNNGNVTLHNVTVSNDPAGFTGSGPVPGIASCEVGGTPVTDGALSLAPGAQVVCVTTPYTVTQADVVAGTPIANKATVMGTPPDGSGLVVVMANTTVPATTVRPTVQTGGVVVGRTVPWVAFTLIGLVTVGGIALTCGERQRKRA